MPVIARRRLVLAGAALALVGLAPGLPVAAAVETDQTPRLYMVSPSSEPDTITTWSTVNVIDPQTQTITKQVPTLGYKPHHFYPVPGKDFAYITHFGGAGTPKAIEVFDMVRNEITGTIPVGADGPRHLTFSPDYKHAYTADFDGGAITDIDVDAGTAVRTVQTGVKPNYIAYARTRAGDRLFVVNFGEDTMTVLDAHTLDLIGKVRVGSGPFNLVVTPDQREVITANARDNTVTFVDAVTLRVEKVVSIGGVHAPLANTFQRLNVRISPEGKWLWVGNEDASVMSIVSIPQRRLVTQIPAGLGADIAFFPAAGPAKGYALITNRYDYFVTVAKLNGTMPPTFVKNIPHRAQGSHYITFNKDYTKAYVSQRPGGAFSVLDMATLTNEHDSIPVGPGPDQAFYVWFENGHPMFHSESDSC